jgi:cobalamin biosynthetic protein CobC
MVLPETPLHGGSGEDYLRAHYPHAATPWLDLSTGINPWPYPHTRISDAALHALPSPAREHRCKAAAAEYLGVSPQNIALVAGSQAAISLLPGLFAPSSVAIMEPTYGEHRPAWERAGHQVGSFADAASDASIAVLTNPNNPDGRVWPREELERISLERSRQNKWLIVDEAFADVTPSVSVASICSAGQTIVIRSFGKFFGLAGVRLGLVVAPTEIVNRLEERAGPWAVSGPALEIGTRGYLDKDWQAETRDHLAERAGSFKKLLIKYGLEYVGGTDLFLLATHPRAASLFDLFCAHGIYVRRFADQNRLRFGLPPDETACARIESVFAAWTKLP